MRRASDTNAIRLINTTAILHSTAQHCTLRLWSYKERT